MMKMKRKRIVAGLLTLMLLIGTLCSSVFAADVTKVSEKTGSNGSIVVTVYNQTPGNAGTGAQAAPGGTPVKDVGINALKIGSVVELTTSETGTVKTQVAFGLTEEYVELLGLQEATPLASKDSIDYYAPQTVQSAVEAAGIQQKLEDYLDKSDEATNQETIDDGTATFSSLSYGLYLLAKSELPSNATTDLVPFLVSVPMYVESNSGDAWQSTVYAYPKVRTGDITISKTVDDNDDTTYADGDIYVNAGQTLKYTVTATIPEAATGNGSATPFTSFVITDTNAHQTLNVNTGTLSVKLGTTPLTGVDKAIYEGSPEQQNTYDYYYTYADAQTPDTDTVLTVTLTNAGLEELNSGLSNKQTLTVTYDATLATDVAFQTAVTNTAVLSYQRQGMSAPDTSKQDTVDLYTYGIDLTKTLSDNGTITVETIKFALYSDATCQTPIKVEAAAQGGTGYWRNDAADSSEMYVGTDKKLNLYGLEPGTYYLKELKTMEDYTLLDGPITLVISDADQNGTAEATANGTNATVASGVVSLSVENTKNTNGFTLPATGGEGTLVVTAIGLGFLCVAVILLAVYRKKTKN